MIKFLWLVFLAALGALWITPAQASVRSGPSFACTAKASKVERTICGDPELAAEDRLMAQLYGLAKVSAFGKGPSNQAAAQHEWLKTRDYCMQVDSPRSCVARAYAERNEKLALAVLFRRPDIAMPELRRLDPEASAMFEAIHLYSRVARLNEADRRRVVGLLERYKATPGGWGNPTDAVKSDAAFAEFVGVRSAGIGGESNGRAFPCAAAVRKPKLVDATAPRFGSNMDNFIFESDCGETLPPLPRLDLLVEHRRTGMGDCGGGSIRFAYFSSFRNSVVAARLATGAQLRKGPVKPFPPRRKVTSADVNAAVGELSAYYLRYGRASGAEAPILARQMVYDLLEQAWQC